jgi:D-alanyl-D-alanine dipeptidase
MELSPRAALERAAQQPEFVDLTHLANVKVDLRYGTTNNLLGLDVYGGYQRILLHRVAAQKFEVASRLLAERHPGLRFLVLDALRPQTAQRKFWALVAGTAQQPYFADPAKGSIHSFGFAIDLTLVDGDGLELPMGTEFDDLSPLAEPRREEEFLREGKLSPQALANRHTLREIMAGAGFIPLPHEWWHFDALSPAEVRASYRIVE